MEKPVHRSLSACCFGSYREPANSKRSKQPFAGVL